MGGELSCPCGRRLDLNLKPKGKTDFDIITEVMKGKLQKENLLYEYAVNNDIQSSKVYLISTSSIEGFFANRNLLIIETKHDINYYYNKAFVCNFLNQEAIAFVLLQYQKGQEDRSTFYSKSKTNRLYKHKDYSAVYKVETINFISKDNNKIKEQIINDLYCQLKKEYYLFGIITDPAETSDDITYSSSYKMSSIKNNYKIVYKKSKLSDNLDIQYYILIYSGRLTSKIITSILKDNKAKALKSVIEIKEGEDDYNNNNNKNNGSNHEISYFFIFEESKKTPEFDENEFFVVKIEKDRSPSDLYLKDIAEKVNMQTCAEIVSIINDKQGFFIIFRYNINSMDDN